MAETTTKLPRCYRKKIKLKKKKWHFFNMGHGTLCKIRKMNIFPHERIRRREEEGRSPWQHYWLLPGFVWKSTRWWNLDSIFGSGQFVARVCGTIGVKNEQCWRNAQRTLNRTLSYTWISQYRSTGILRAFLYIFLIDWFPFIGLNGSEFGVVLLWACL